MREKLDRYKYLKYIFLTASGFLTALTLMVTRLGAFEWVTLVPAAMVFITLSTDREVGYRRVYLYGFIYHMSFCLSIFHWLVLLYPVLSTEGMADWEAIGVVVFAWIGLSLLQASFAALSEVIIVFILRRIPFSNKKLFTPFIAAAVFTVFEWMQTLTWAGVPWGRLPIGQTAVTLMFKSASVLGSYFITFLIVCVNFFLALFILMKGEEKRRLCLASAVSLFAVNIAIGSAAMIFDEKDGEKFTAAAIQVNSSSHEKWNDDSLDTLIERTEKYCLEAASEGASLIVLPETVFANYPLRNSQTRLFIKKLAVECNATIVVGGFTEGEELDRNSLVFVHPDGSIDETAYSKRHLVPFGEYVPMRDIVMAVFPPLGEISMLGEDLAPGEDSDLVYSQVGILGGLVCFDSIYENLALDSARDGAEVLVLGTNDSWFFDSAAVYMHNAQAKLRAVETGRYLVRSANTGISSIIDPDGRILDEEPPLVPGYVIADISARQSLTVYTVIGNLFVYLLIFALMILIFFPKALLKIKKIEKNIDFERLK